MRPITILPPLLATAAVLALVTTERSRAYSLTGESLGLLQRHQLVYDNFPKTSSGGGPATHPSFPGATGPALAIWKASVEWGSRLHGDGSGDPHQPFDLGSGGANFDPTWQGAAPGVGNMNSNTHSGIAGSSGGVPAFVEYPSSDGWRIRYYTDWNWFVGPGTAPAGDSIDLQGLATHMIGHVVGLGHSTVAGATMQGTFLGDPVSARSIEADDSAGIQAIYGVAAPTKPVITALAGGGAPGTVAILGSQFSVTGNEVWFTHASGGGGPVKVTGVSSISGGTQIVVSIPPTAGPGDILVKKVGSGHNKLSNAWPIDTDAYGNPPLPSIANISPSSIDAVVVDQVVTVTITGSGFLGTTDVQVDGQSLSSFPPEYLVVSDSQIDITVWPLVSLLGAVDITVVTPGGSATGQITVTPNSPPALELVGSVPAFLFNATGIDLAVGAGPGDLAWVFFSGSNLPSVLPGILNLGVGNNFSSLFLITVVSIGPAGHTSLALPVSGVPPGLTIHFQAAVLDVSSGALPLLSTNVQTGTFAP